MSNRLQIFKAVQMCIALCAVLLGGLLLWELDERVENIQSAETRDPLWLQSRLQVETQRLISELWKYSVGSSSKDEVLFRYDLVWSRASVLTSSKITTLISEFGVDPDFLTAFEARLRALEGNMFALPAEALTVEDRHLPVREIVASLDELHSELQEFSLDLAQGKTSVMSSFRTDLMSLSGMLTIAALGTCVLVLIVFATVILELRQARSFAEEAKRLAEEAESAVTAKNNFITAVSHEMRTPLTSILGGLKLLRAQGEEISTAPAAKLIEIAERNGERLLQFVNDILDLERLSSGATRLHQEVVEIYPFFQSVLEECEMYARRTGVRLTVEYQCEDARIEIDRAKTTQVLTNLISNAVKFSGTANLVTVVVDLDNSALKVEVIDRGIGIDETDHPKIFERFHQSAPGTVGSVKSTGLGLSISKQIIDLLGGSIGFTSVKGEGSSFWFSIPVGLPERSDADLQFAFG